MDEVPSHRLDAIAVRNAHAIVAFHALLRPEGLTRFTFYGLNHVPKGVQRRASRELILQVLDMVQKQR